VPVGSVKRYDYSIACTRDFCAEEKESKEEAKEVTK
jgi:hypothetical protein